MKIKNAVSVLTLAFLPFVLMAQTCRMPSDMAASAEYGPGDSVRIVSAVGALTPMAGSGASMPEMLIACAKHYLGTPYVAGSLEKVPERLIINAGETDCILFVEMCLATCLTARDGGGFQEYCDNVRNLRYRDGIVDGYASRIHYTSEWIRQAERRGVLEEVTSSIGGKPFPQTFSFMSTHTDSYAQLASGDAAAKKELSRIRAAEQSLSADRYWLLRKADVSAHMEEIRDGDIICFDTAVNGLDIAHVAFAFRQNGRLTFIHASSAAGKVIINPAPLAEYLNSRRSLDGIRILRVK